MNEFIKKLIEKLEKLKQNYTEDCGTRIRAKLCQEAGECGQCSVVQAIEIVNQLAKEHNNGWIPCSERLPENNQIVIFADEDGDVNCGWYEAEKNWCVNEAYFPNAFRFIAWQPLPPKYEP